LTKPLPFDSTLKTGIPQSNLPLNWLTSINATFRGLAEQHFRSKTWQEYAQEVFVLRQAVIQLLKQLETELDAYFRKSVAVQLPGTHTRSDDWLHLQMSLKKYPLLPSCALDEWGFVDEYTVQQRKDIHSLLEKRGLIIQEYMPFLPAFKEYTHTLDNFFNHAIQTMIFNSRFGKGNKAEAERLKAVEQLQQQGEDTNMPRSSTLDFAGGIKVLGSLQEGFNQLLSQYVDKRTLTNLEEQERLLFYSIWSVWYCFANHPNLVLKDAKQECPKQVISNLKKMRQLMQREFAKLASNLSVTIISKDNLWESKPALWLTVNGKNAVDVYNSVEQIIIAIRHAMGDSEDTELRRYTLSFYWPDVVIVPLVRGKSLNTMAWRISFSVLLHEETDLLGLNWWNFVLHSIAQDEINKMGLETWNLPRLADATTIWTSTVELSLLAGHIRDFKSLPKPDDFGKELLQEYDQSLEGRISNILQVLGSAMGKIVDTFNDIAPTEYTHRPNLIAAVQALQELGHHIIPPTYAQSEAGMSLEQLVEWADQLEKASDDAFLLYLLWASDILDATNI